MTAARPLAAFGAGLFLVNAVPHGVHGLSGRPFPSPFGSPPGVGLSSPTQNVVWSLVNASVGLALLRGWTGSGAERPALAAGATSMAFFLSSYFGRVLSD